MRETQDMKVFLLNGGSLLLDGYHLFWNVGPGGPIRVPVCSILIEHPEGRFLFDTGFDLDYVSREIPIEVPWQSPGHTISGGLAKLGLRPEDVSAVVNSHLHMDHVGGNKFFPHAVKICQRAEYDRALAPRRFELGAYGDLSFSAELAERRGRTDVLRHGQTAHNTEFTLLEGDVELAKGVRVISTPGHSAGHCSLLLEPSGRRPMLFPFDAAYTKRNMTAFIQGGFHSDPSAGERSLQRLIDVAAEHDAEIVFTHDPEAPQLAVEGDLLARERRA